jgi:hypothetical protein
MLSISTSLDRNFSTILNTNGCNVLALLCVTGHPLTLTLSHWERGQENPKALLPREKGGDEGT